MKTAITLSLLMLGALLSNAQDTLNHPQKIIIDAQHHRYLVSNFSGGGDLVAIDSMGNLTTFIPNAGLIDAIQIVGDTVYGSVFGGKVRGYDLNTGLLVMELNLSGEGVTVLTGFVADSNGILYTSERFGNRIFKINPRTYEYWVFVEGNGISLPNGLLYEPEYNRILVCLDTIHPPILAINLSDSTVYTVATTNLEGSDGIAKDMYGNYYVTGYYLPGIYKFNPDFSEEPELFFEGNGIVYPTYNEAHHSLLITYYDDHDWGEIPLQYTSILFNEIQKEFELGPIYPNPFVDKTTIKFELNTKSQISIEIFDSSGKSINMLLNENKQAGTYSVSWNGKNNSGQQVSNGTYYFRLTVNGNTEYSSIILL